MKGWVIEDSVKVLSTNSLSSVTNNSGSKKNQAMLYFVSCKQHMPNVQQQKTPKAQFTGSIFKILYDTQDDDDSDIQGRVEFSCLSTLYTCCFMSNHFKSAHSLHKDIAYINSNNRWTK